MVKSQRKPQVALTTRPAEKTGSRQIFLQLINFVNAVHTFVERRKPTGKKTLITLKHH